MRIEGAIGDDHGAFRNSLYQRLTAAGGGCVATRRWSVIGLLP